jgi:phosphoribosylformylglycinamidine (FGAM) synthase PurS component
MIVSNKEIEISGYDAFEVVSDAADNEAATREIEQWCVLNNCTPSGMQTLSLVRRDNHEYYAGLAYPAASTVEQGKKIYKSKIQEKLDDRDIGKMLAIDVETEDYSIANDEIAAINDLESKQKNPRTYLMRVGYSALAGVGTIVPRSN